MTSQSEGGAAGTPQPARGATAIDAAAVRWGADGLVPGIVQDDADGRVLMVGYLDEEALAATLATREVHFHSRSRGRLWRKGETSGNVLRLREVELDCDGDAILLHAEPAGPTCHRGTRSCFDPAGADAIRPTQGFAWLEALWSTIESRAAERPEGSYTARLLAAGVDAAARKLSEEAVEVVLAAKDDAATALAASGEPVRAQTRARVAEEMADLVYHALVLLAERGVPPGQVIEVLRARSTNRRP